MNENIRNLWDECTNCPTPHYYGEYELLQKFAEKIVKECISQIEPSTHHQAYPNGYLGGEDGLTLLENNIEHLKKHFGIEE